jgi:hypothetical protein
MDELQLTVVAHVFGVSIKIYSSRGALYDRVVAESSLICSNHPARAPNVAPSGIVLHLGHLDQWHYVTLVRNSPIASHATSSSSTSPMPPSSNSSSVDLQSSSILSTPSPDTHNRRNNSSDSSSSSSHSRSLVRRRSPMHAQGLTAPSPIHSPSLSLQSPNKAPRKKPKSSSYSIATPADATTPLANRSPSNIALQALEELSLVSVSPAPGPVLEDSPGTGVQKNLCNSFASVSAEPPVTRQGAHSMPQQLAGELPLGDELKTFLPYHDSLEIKMNPRLSTRSQSHTHTHTHTHTHAHTHHTHTHITHT